MNPLAIRFFYLPTVLALFLLRPSISWTQTEADELYDRGTQIADTSTEDAIPILYQAAEAYRDAGDLEHEVLVLDEIGRELSEIGEVDSAKAIYAQAITLAHEGHNSIFLLETYYHYIAHCFTNQGNYGDALRIGLEISHIVERQGSLREKFWSNKILEQIYFYLPEHTEEYLNLAISSDSIATELDDTLLMEESIFALAVAYTRTDQQEMAKSAYKKLITIELEKGASRVFASINNLAGRYADESDWDSARYYYELGEIYAIKYNKPVGVAASNLYRGMIEFELENYRETIRFTEKALQTFQESNILRRQDVCAQYLYMAHKELGNSEEALYYHELESTLNDSIKRTGKTDETKLIQQSFKHDLRVLSDSLNHSHQQELKDAELGAQKKRGLYLFIGLGISLLFGIFIFNRFRVTRRQKAVIEDQKSEIDLQHQQLKESHSEIRDSITYAKRIQSAILPSDRIIQEKLPESFVIYMPKDVVAGDFYWLETFSNSPEILVAAADCTGHGVPGAMVSVVCHNSLNRAVREFGLKEPSAILNKVRELVIETFEKSDKEIKDGMDIALISVNGKNLKFSGAHNPLWVCRKGELIEIKADKQPIGKFDVSEDFTPHEIELEDGDVIYIFTDGYVDQFGGDKGKKFKSANFKSLIKSLDSTSMEAQKEEITKAFYDWKGNLEQVDDVCVIGIKI